MRVRKIKISFGKTLAINKKARTRTANKYGNLLCGEKLDKSVPLIIYDNASTPHNAGFARVASEYEPKRTGSLSKRKLIQNA